MEIFRASVTLLSLCLFHSCQSETESMCKGNLPSFQHVALNSSVTVACPVLTAPEMVYRLYKGSEEIFFISVNNTSISKSNNIPRMDFTVNVADNSTSFILDAVTKNTTALYTCKAQRIFPPPFQEVENKPQTIVFVEERPVKQQAVCQNVSYLFYWVLLGAMVIYGLVMTCIVFLLRIKLRQMDIPFKDRECRRKWQGVQHPTWQGFYIE
ncbi:T-cell-specific surface glycoprotein CD28 homolog [Carassius carassius]|uniref:T-cell-specific surface glycoprotein CD28 homolog n=1 Tax=Carassius carassius TaxID=217509 RepID=UPI0028693F00|nr:T-cell-specific surface glycoprotein CD28 homolog [Carassius carassius]